MLLLELPWSIRQAALRVLRARGGYVYATEHAVHLTPPAGVSYVKLGSAV